MELKTHNDYEAALLARHVVELSADEYDALTAAIEAYEADHYGCAEAMLPTFKETIPR